jgi:hypothetical protein
MTGTLRKTHVMISSGMFRRIRNIWHTSCTENHNTYFMTRNVFPKIVPFMRCGKKHGTAREATDGGNIIRRMRSACCITKAKDTHSEYVILIAFPQLKWSRESVWMLRSYVRYLYCYTASPRTLLCSLIQYCIKEMSTKIFCKVFCIYYSC